VDQDIQQVLAVSRSNPYFQKQSTHWKQHFAYRLAIAFYPKNSL
jgi:hypothetical protein